MKKISIQLGAHNAHPLRHRKYGIDRVLIGLDYGIVAGKGKRENMDKVAPGRPQRQVVMGWLRVLKRLTKDICCGKFIPFVAKKLLATVIFFC